MDSCDQTDSPAVIQFCQKMSGFFIPTGQRIHNLLNWIVNKDFSILPIHPAVLNGKLHPIQQYAIQQLGIRGQNIKNRVGKEDLRNPIKRIRICLVSIMEWEMQRL